MSRFKMRSNCIRGAIMVFAILFLIFSFQNCSGPNALTNSSESAGGVGTELILSDNNLTNASGEAAGNGNGSGYGGQDDRSYFKNCVTKNMTKPTQIAIMFRGSEVKALISSPPQELDVLENKLDQFTTVSIVENQGVYTFSLLNYIFSSEIDPKSNEDFYGVLIEPNSILGPQDMSCTWF